MTVRAGLGALETKFLRALTSQLGHRGGQYHLLRLTWSKTRGC